MFPNQIPWDTIPSILSDVKSGQVTITTITKFLWLVGCAITVYGKPSFSTTLDQVHVAALPQSETTETSTVKPLEQEALPGGIGLWVLIGRLALSLLLGSKGQ